MLEAWEPGGAGDVHAAGVMELGAALHNHMLDDQPHLFFMHFWANDDAQKLAKGLRAALDKINVTRS